MEATVGERLGPVPEASGASPDTKAEVVTTPLPRRHQPGVTSFASTSDLASALRRASAAHEEHEQRTGVRDANWPDWYAAYLVAEQTGERSPA